MQGKPTRFKTPSLIHCENYSWFLGARLQHGNQLQLVLGSGCSTAISYSLEPGCSTAISCSWFWGQTAARQSAVVCGSGCSTAISYSWLGGQVAARQSSVICFGARLQNSSQLQFGARLQHCNLLQFGARMQHDKQLQLVLRQAAALQSAVTSLGCQAAARQSAAFGFLGLWRCW